MFCLSSMSGSSRSTASSSAASMPGSPEPARSTSTFWRTIMYAITGITGKVGGAVARSLLADRLPVRAVLRDKAKAAEWRTRGCDIALAEMDDTASLTSAFRAAAGVFILPPSEFDPEPDFPEAKRVIELDGPARISRNDLARTFATVLKRTVRVETVPRESWEQIFRSQGMRNPLPRIRMLDGFNEGWIEFSEHGRSAMKGTTALENVIAELVRASQAKASV